MAAMAYVRVTTALVEEKSGVQVDCIYVKLAPAQPI
jgi:hypothetical protein